MRGTSICHGRTGEQRRESFSPQCHPLDTFPHNRDNVSPVPLKHSLETAYMVFLGLVICMAGFVSSMLPEFPRGLVYWLFACVLSLLYALVLTRTLRSNRADYEFRLLHWFPFCIFVLWGFLQYFAPRFRLVYILKLGFLFLWALPLTALGISFTILFAVHVIRRRAFRVTILSVFLALYLIGALVAEGKGWNPLLQQRLFALPPARILSSVTSVLRTLTGLIYREDQSGAILMADHSVSSSTPSVVSMQSDVTSIHTPKRLPRSGPESAGVLLVFLLAGYCSVLHRRQESE